MREFLKLPLNMFKKYFVLNGDTSRRDYWLSMLWVAILIVLSQLLTYIVGFFNSEIAIMIPALIITILALPTISMTCRRYSDSGLPWFVGLAYTIGVFINELLIMMYSVYASFQLKLYESTGYILLTDIEMYLFLVAFVLMVVTIITGAIPLFMRENKFKTKRYAILLCVILLTSVAIAAALTYTMQ